MKFPGLLLPILYLESAIAFHSPSIPITPLSTALGATLDRRNVLTTSASLTTAIATGFVPPLHHARADASDLASIGKIVEFKVSNLNDGSTGIIQIQLEPEWSPRGVARLEELLSIGFYDQCRFFRVLPGFVAQFGITGDPKVQAQWKSKPILDDPVRVSNDRGTVVFATAGPNTRTTQLFINTNPNGNSFLDRQGFSPIGKVIQGMEVVDKFYSGYGEGAPSGRGPSQGLLQVKGNSYLEEEFPKLSYISEAKLL